jgi:hypothetical protein
MIQVSKFVDKKKISIVKKKIILQKENNNNIINLNEELCPNEECNGVHSVNANFCQNVEHLYTLYCRHEMGENNKVCGHKFSRGVIYCEMCGEVRIL